jgi:hypothetical protein
MKKAIAAAAIAAGSVAAAWGAAVTPWSDTRVPSPDQARVLEALNARRKAARARPLEWDPVAASVLLEVFRDTKQPAEKTVDDRLERGHGFNTGWTWSSLGTRDPVAAAEELGGELLGREYTHGAVAAFDDLGRAWSDGGPLRMRPRGGSTAGPYLSVAIPAASCLHGLPRGTRSQPSVSRLSGLHRGHEERFTGPTWYVGTFAPPQQPVLAWQVNQKVRAIHPKADQTGRGGRLPGDQRDGTKLPRHRSSRRRTPWGDVCITGLQRAIPRLRSWRRRAHSFETAIDAVMTRRYPPRLEMHNYFTESSSTTRRSG